MKLPVGLQLYSVRDDAARDFDGTVRAVKEMGYDGVELAGTYGLEMSYIKDVLAKYQLTPISAHVPYVDMIADPENVLKSYKDLGCSYIAVPYLTEEYRPGTDKFAEVVKNIEKLGGICHKLGMTLLYHNHDFEFAKVDDGRYALDYLYDTVDADHLQTELDTCWVSVGGENPAQYVTKYAGRSPIVHLKDYVGEKSESMYELIGIKSEKKADSGKFEFRAVGEGKQNWDEILTAVTGAHSKWVVVEQDAHYGNTPLEDARISRENLKKLGW